MARNICRLELSGITYKLHEQALEHEQQQFKETWADMSLDTTCALVTNEETLVCLKQSYCDPIDTEMQNYEI